MSQTKSKLSKLTVKNREPETASRGGNTLVFLDDKPLPGVTFLKIECKPNKIMKVQLEMIVKDVDIEAMVNLRHVESKPVKPEHKWTLDTFFAFDPEQEQE